VLGLEHRDREPADTLVVEEEGLRGSIRLTRPGSVDVTLWPTQPATLGWTPPDELGLRKPTGLARGSLEGVPIVGGSWERRAVLGAQEGAALARLYRRGATYDHGCLRVRTGRPLSRERLVELARDALVLGRALHLPRETLVERVGQRALHEPGPPDRYAALDLLVSRRPDHAVTRRVLERAHTDADPQVRRLAGLETRTPPVEELRRWAQDTTAPLSLQLRILADLPEAHGPETLAAILHRWGPDEETRLIPVLNGLPESRQEPLWRLCVQHADPPLRLKAVRALRLVGNRDSVEALLAAKKAAATFDFDLKYACEDTLRYIRNRLQDGSTGGLAVVHEDAWPAGGLSLAEPGSEGGELTLAGLAEEVRED